MINALKKLNNISASDLKKIIKNSSFISGMPEKGDIFLQRNIFKYILKHNEFANKIFVNVSVEQNLLDNAVIYKKVLNKNTNIVEKIPYSVGIAKSEDHWKTTFHIIDNDTKKEIGFVCICDWQKAKNYKYISFITDSNLQKNYPEYGINGNRISIDYVKNNFPAEYSGLGKISDQIAIEYCLKNNIKPCIVSMVDGNSHAAHYKRGRRFLPVDKYDKDLDYYDFVKEYGTDDPNKIIEERIAATPEGQKVDTSDLYGLYMYMPSEIINLYLEMIKKHPVLHKEK